MPSSKPRKTKLGRRAAKPAAANITTVIFDLGDVLLHDTEEQFERDHAFKKLPRSKQQRYNRAWNKAETGKKTTTYLLNEIKRIFNLPVSAAQISTYMTHTKQIKPMVKLFRQVAKRYRVAILTNNEKSWPKRQAKYAGLNLTGIHIFNSGKIGIKKPSPGIYVYALRRLKAKPQQTVFIDDHIRNVRAARKLGIHGIHFTGNVGKLRDSLKKLGLSVTMK